MIVPILSDQKFSFFLNVENSWVYNTQGFYWLYMSFSINFGCRSTYVTINRTNKKEAVDDNSGPTFSIFCNNLYPFQNRGDFCINSRHIFSSTSFPSAYNSHKKSLIQSVTFILTLWLRSNPNINTHSHVESKKLLVKLLQKKFHTFLRLQQGKDLFLHFHGRFLHTVRGQRIVWFGFPTVDFWYVVQVIEMSVHISH